jgi:hypothetical protein
MSERKACYRVYLEQFLDAGDVSYEEVSDILSRYDTLKGANIYLMNRVDTVSLSFSFPCPFSLLISLFTSHLFPPPPSLKMMSMNFALNYKI